MIANGDHLENIDFQSGVVISDINTKLKAKKSHLSHFDPCSQNHHLVPFVGGFYMCTVTDVIS